MAFVSRLAEEDQAGVENLVWKHRDFKPRGTAHYVCQGIVRLTDLNLRSDIFGAFREAVPLIRWVRGQERLLLHAHSRLGIFASFFASLLTRTPLMMHFHALASRPWFYRILWQLCRAQPVFNSSKTCRHFGEDPARSLVIMPPLAWPNQAQATRVERTRFIACGAFVRGKHFDLLLRAFQQLWQEQKAAELHIYGVSTKPADAVCQREIVAFAQNNPAVHLHEWDPHWSEYLDATDIFVHLGLPESFGMVILEAFARGCKLVVLRDTFLEDLAQPLDSTGIYAADTLSPAAVALRMKEASCYKPAVASLWELRRAASPLFSPEESRTTLAGAYARLKD